MREQAKRTNIYNSSVYPQVEEYIHFINAEFCYNGEEYKVVLRFQKTGLLKSFYLVGIFGWLKNMIKIAIIE